MTFENYRFVKLRRWILSISLYQTLLRVMLWNGDGGTVTFID